MCSRTPSICGVGVGRRPRQDLEPGYPVRFEDGGGWTTRGPPKPSIDRITPDEIGPTLAKSETLREGFRRGRATGDGAISETSRPGHELPRGLWSATIVSMNDGSIPVTYEERESQYGVGTDHADISADVPSSLWSGLAVLSSEAFPASRIDSVDHRRGHDVRPVCGGSTRLPRPIPIRTDQRRGSALSYSGMPSTAGADRPPGRAIRYSGSRQRPLKSAPTPKDLNSLTDTAEPEAYRFPFEPGADPGSYRSSQGGISLSPVVHSDRPEENG